MVNFRVIAHLQTKLQTSTADRLVHYNHTGAEPSSRQGKPVMAVDWGWSYNAEAYWVWGLMS